MREKMRLWKESLPPFPLLALSPPFALSLPPVGPSVPPSSVFYDMLHLLVGGDVCAAVRCVDGIPAKVHARARARECARVCARAQRAQHA